MKPIYISGPMRGIKHFNFDAFYEAEDYLSSALLVRMPDEIINPARLDVEQHGFDRYPDENQSITTQMMHQWMQRDLGAVASARAICLLPGWEKSEGARRELQVAVWCGLQRFTYDPSGPWGARLGIPTAADVAAVLGGVDKPTTVGTTFTSVSTAIEKFPSVTADPWQAVIDEDAQTALQAAVTQFDLAFAGGGVPQARPLKTLEQNEVLGIFNDMLSIVMADGGNKRARGEKPSWKVDSHLERGLGHVYRFIYEDERFDKDSGANPLIHAAARFLMHAWQIDEALGLHTAEEPAS